MEELNNHLDLYNQTIFNLDWWKNKIVNFSIDTNTRITLAIIVIILQLYNFYNIPQRLSNEKKILKYTYNNHYLLIYSLVIILNVLFLFYILEKTETLVDKYKIIGGIGLFLLFLLIYINSRDEPTTKTDTFDPPPKKIHTYKYRIGLNIFIMILIMYQFIIEYNLNIPNLEENSKLQKYFYNRFGGYSLERKNKVLFFSGWGKFIELIIQIFIIILTITYYPCKYNLPSSWEF
jgi:hypothetical protein